MKNKIVFLTLIVCMAAAGVLQANNKKANRYFELYRYSKAIPLYKKSLSSRDEAVKREATIRLGDCYRLINDPWEAQSWYSRALLFPEPEPMVYFYLGQALQRTEQYEEALAAFRNYTILNPSDPRGKIMAGFCESVKELSGLPPSAEIRNVPSINTRYSEFSPVFYEEGIVFASDRKISVLDEITDDWTSNSFLDLFYAEPKYFRNFWMDMRPPVKMPEVFNQEYHDGPVSFSSDLKMVFLTRTTREKVRKDNDQVMTNRLQIVYGRMPMDKTSRYESFPYNNEAWSVAHPTSIHNGNKLIFSSDMPGGFGGSDLYFSEVINRKWTEPVNLGPAINTFGHEVFPYWLNDSTLWFSSDGHPGFGGLDLFGSKLKDGNWSAPVNLLKPLNSSYDDFGIVFNPEKKSGFFSSDRSGGSGSDDIYAFRFPEKKEPVIVTQPFPPVTEVIKKSVCGRVLGKSSQLPVPDATLFLLDSQTGEVLISKTDQSGQFRFPVEEKRRYIVKAMKNGFFEDCNSFGFEKIPDNECLPLPENLTLEKYNLDQVFTIRDIYYDLNQWELRPDALSSLNHIIRLMEAYPISIELSSHTDSRSSGSYNLLLSRKRADTARKYIIAAGINPARIVAMGYGETRLVNRCADKVPCSESEHQANRRTEFKITSLDTPLYGKKVFDPSSFREGGMLTVEMFDPEFFTACLSDQDIPSSGKSAVPTIQNDQGKIISGKESPAETTGNPAVVPGNTFFTVQIASGKPVTGFVFDSKGEPVFQKEIDGYTKYYIGIFTDLKAASGERQRVRSKFPGAFIVAFLRGEVVPVSELKEILK